MNKNQVCSYVLLPAVVLFVLAAIIDPWFVRLTLSWIKDDTILVVPSTLPWLAFLTHRIGVGLSFGLLGALLGLVVYLCQNEKPGKRAILVGLPIVGVVGFEACWLYLIWQGINFLNQYPSPIDIPLTIELSGIEVYKMGLYPSVGVMVYLAILFWRKKRSHAL